MATTSKDYSQIPLSEHPKKLIRFAEIYAKGVFSIAEAARQAGYKQSVADGRAYEWLGKTRDDSLYPILWDYYEKLRRENLREFDITANSIARELALIGFSDLTRFIDLPSKEYERKAKLANDTERAIYAVQSYPELMDKYRRDLEQYHKDCERQDQQKAGRKKKLVQPDPPTAPTDEQTKLYESYRLLDDEARADLMFWRNYRAGSIRLKNREEIPAALYPVLAEISETKDGIKVKLHDKISALDKLAKWQKMYAADAEEDGGESKIVTEINLVVNGSKSTLLQTDKAA